MADTIKQLCAATLDTTAGGATLYTTPASTKAIVRCYSLCNKTSAPVHASIWLNDKALVYEHDVPANDTITKELAHVLEATHTIKAKAEAVTSIDLIVSGMEVV